MFFPILLFFFVTTDMSASQKPWRANNLFSPAPVYMMLDAQGRFNGLDGRNGNFIDFGMNLKDAQQQFKPLLFNGIQAGVVQITSCSWALESRMPCWLVQVGKDACSYMLATAPQGCYASPIIDADGRVIIFKKSMSGLFTPHIEKPYIGKTKGFGVAQRFAQINTALYANFQKAYQDMQAENPAGMETLFTDGCKGAWNHLLHGNFSKKVEELIEPSVSCSDEQKQNIAYFLQEWHTKVFAKFVNIYGQGTPFVMPQSLLAEASTDAVYKNIDAHITSITTQLADETLTSTIEKAEEETKQASLGMKKSFAQVVRDGLPQLSAVATKKHATSVGNRLCLSAARVITVSPINVALVATSKRKNKKKGPDVAAAEDIAPVTGFSEDVITMNAGRKVQLLSPILLASCPTEETVHACNQGLQNNAIDHNNQVKRSFESNLNLQAVVGTDTEKSVEALAKEVAADLDHVISLRCGQLQHGNYDAMKGHCKYIAGLILELNEIAEKHRRASESIEDLFELADFQNKFLRLHQAFIYFRQYRCLYEEVKFIRKNNNLPDASLQRIKEAVHMAKFENWIGLLFGTDSLLWFDPSGVEDAQVRKQVGLIKERVSRSLPELTYFHDSILDVCLHNICHTPEFHPLTKAAVDIYNELHISEDVLLCASCNILQNDGSYIDFEQTTLASDCINFFMILHHKTVAACAILSPEEIGERYFVKASGLSYIKQVLQRGLYQAITLEAVSKELSKISAAMYLLRHNPESVASEFLQDVYDIHNVMIELQNDKFSAWTADNQKKGIQKKQAQELINKIYIPFLDFFAKDTLLYETEHEQWGLTGIEKYQQDPYLQPSMAYHKMRLFGLMRYIQDRNFQEMYEGSCCIISIMKHLTDGLSLATPQERFTVGEKEALQPLKWKFRDYLYFLKSQGVSEGDENHAMFKEYSASLFQVIENISQEQAAETSDE